MKIIKQWWVCSDKLKYGTYAQTKAAAEEIRQSLINAGGTDVRIEYDPIVY